MSVSYLFHPWISWVVSTFWPLCTMELWTFMYKVLCGHTFSLLSGSHLLWELCVYVLRNCQLFSKAGTLFFTLLLVCKYSNLFTSSEALLITDLFNYSLPSEYEVQQHSFTPWFVFLWWLMKLSIFSYAYWPCVYFFEEMSVQILCSFLN